MNGRELSRIGCGNRKLSGAFDPVARAVRGKLDGLSVQHGKAVKKILIEVESKTWNTSRKRVKVRGVKPILDHALEPERKPELLQELPTPGARRDHELSRSITCPIGLHLNAATRRSRIA